MQGLACTRRRAIPLATACRDRTVGISQDEQQHAGQVLVCTPSAVALNLAQRHQKAKYISNQHCPPAVALNLAQLVAFFSHSRLSRKKVSTVVPQCISELENTVAEWHTLHGGGLGGRRGQAQSTGQRASRALVC